MWSLEKKRTVRAFALALFGFALGTLGISAFAGTGAVKDAWRALLSSSSPKDKTADACMLSDAPTDNDDQIYFISCGGIY